MNYKTMEELLRMIEDRPLARKLSEVYTTNLSRFQTAHGSQHNHQAWEGGYLDHVTDTMNIARLLYASMHQTRNLTFTLSDALVVLFLHDLEKAWPDRISKLCQYGMTRSKAKDCVRSELLNEFRILSLINEDNKNAIYNAEGEKENYSPQHRVMGPLAAFVHVCDITSARIWFDHPRVDDKWGWRESIDTKERANAPSTEAHDGSKGTATASK